MIPQNRNGFGADENLKEWTAILKRFSVIAEAGTPPGKCKSELEAIRNDAARLPLTLRQQSAMLARVNNYINGEYGNTKRPEHFTSAKA